MAPLLGGIDQAFQFIQEYTGIVSPGILAVFVMGLFWKSTTNNAAIWGALISIPIAVFLKSAVGLNIFPFIEPWMHQMGITALLTMLVIGIISYLENKGEEDPKAIQLSKSLFHTSPTFNIGSFVVMIILVVLYSMFW